MNQPPNHHQDGGSRHASVLRGPTESPGAPAFDILAAASEPGLYAVSRGSEMTVQTAVGTLGQVVFLERSGELGFAVVLQLFQEQAPEPVERRLEEIPAGARKLLQS